MAQRTGWWNRWSRRRPRRRDRARPRTWCEVLEPRMLLSAPTLAPISNVTLLSGAPLYIPLDGADTDGDLITFTATSSNPNIQLYIPTGNRNLVINVAGFGQMVFELFDDLAPRATDRIATLANAGFYDGVIFHRVINDFMIQGGDPTGTGAGGSTLGNFNDQFNANLQHTRTGLLSMAKSADDTNDSQFFVTEGPQRHLDFNHTIFGLLIEGESVREAISNVPTTADPDGSGPGTRNPNLPDTPITSVVMTNVRTSAAEAAENGVLRLSAPEGYTGSATITVTATDTQGNSVQQTFNVTVTPDTVNTQPWMADVPTIRTPINTPVQFTLQMLDADANQTTSNVNVGNGEVQTWTFNPYFLNQSLLTSYGLTVPVTANANISYGVNPTTGVVTVTPSNGIVGKYDISLALYMMGFGTVNGSTVFSTLGSDYQVVPIYVVPETPGALDLLPAFDTGVSNTDNITNRQDLQFQVTGVRSGATVTLRAGDTIIGQAVASSTAVTVTVTNTAALTNGVHNITATQTVNGAESDRNTALPVTIDRIVPAAFTSSPVTTAYVGQPYAYDVQNPEEGTAGFAYSLTGAPTGMAINGATGVINWTPSVTQFGNITFQVIATDRAGNTLGQNVTVAVDGDPGTVAGRKWQDNNGNGVQDPGEPGLAGVIIYMDSNDNGVRDDGEPFAVTVADDPATPDVDETGHYLITNVPLGGAIVREVVPAGYVQTFPATPELHFVQAVLDGQASGGLTVDGLTFAQAVAVSPDGLHVYAAGTNDDAIAVFGRNASTGALTFIQVIKDGATDPLGNAVDGLDGADWVAVSPDGLYVYVASLTDDAVTVLARNPGTGQLTFVQTIKDGGSDGAGHTVTSLNGATGVVISPDGLHAYVAGRDDNTLTVFSRNTSTGRLTWVQSLVDNAGGVNGLQSVQSLALDPDGQHLYVTGYGEGALAVFSRSPATGQLTPVEVLLDGGTDQSGNLLARLGGAFGVAVSPDGTQVYLTSQLDNALVVFQRNDATGRLTWLQDLVDGSGITGDWLDNAGFVTAAGDAHYVLVASPSNDSLAVFERDSDTGLLAMVQTLRDGGTDELGQTINGPDGASGIAVSPDRRDVYLAGRVDNAVAVFSRVSAGDNPHLVQVTPGGSLTGIDFGNQPFSSSLGDTVWLDLNQNGVQDEGEPGVEGVTVSLLDGQTLAVLDSVVTDADGHYLFDPLLPGSYYVQMDRPDWLAWTSADAGGNDTLDSDVDSTGRSGLITLGIDQNDMSIDGGLIDVAPPQVSAVLLNADETDPADRAGLGAAPTTWSAQRSRWHSLTVQFNEPVTVSAADLQLIWLGTTDLAGQADVAVTLSAGMLTTTSQSATINLTGLDLADGQYELRVLATVTDRSGRALDGNTDGTAGDTYVAWRHLLTGDLNGDSRVDADDLSVWSYWFGALTAPDYLDANGDGGVSVLDLRLLAAAFGQIVANPTPRVPAPAAPVSTSIARPSTSSSIIQAAAALLAGQASLQPVEGDDTAASPYTFDANDNHVRQWVTP